MTITYFAYGSNQSTRQLAERGLEPAESRLAILRGHRFAYDKRSLRGGSCANVALEAGRVVVGTLMRFDDASFERLRAHEGGYGVREVQVEALDEPGPVRALTFVASAPTPAGGPPRVEYVERIMSGLRERNAPASWVDRVVRAAGAEIPAERFAPLRRHDAGAAERVAAGLEAVLVRLRSGWLPAPGYDDAALVAMCRSAVEGQRPASGGFADGSWAILPDADVERDVRFEYGTLPTFTVLAILALVRRAPAIAARVPGLDDALRRGMAYAAGEGLHGHGLDATYDALRAIHVLADGRVPELLAAEPDLSPALARELREACAGLEALATRAGPRGAWGAPARFEVEDAAARLRDSVE